MYRAFAALEILVAGFDVHVGAGHVLNSGSATLGCWPKSGGAIIGNGCVGRGLCVMFK